MIIEFNWIMRLKILFIGKIKIGRIGCINLRRQLNKAIEYDNTHIPQFTNTGNVEYMTKEEIECKEKVQNYE